MIFIINLHVSARAYTEGILGRMKDLLETAAVGIRANVLKTKVIPDERPQDLLSDDEPMEEVRTFKYTDSMLIANCQGKWKHE